MNDVDRVILALESKKPVICQVAPSVRVSIGEEFGLAPGTVVTEKLVGALKKAGFAKVFDTSTAADIVTAEEGTELMGRIFEKERLPLLTSCCSASVLYVENNFPHLLPHFCSVKSPQQTLGSLIKTYCARKLRAKRKDIYSVSIMPCVIKKMEAKRPEMEFNSVKHVDAVLTTKEAAELLKKRKVDLSEAPPEPFDSLIGKGSGAGQLFGTTGGVSESLLRFVSSQLEKTNAREDFPEVRGIGGLREANVKIANLNLRIAVVDGLSNLQDILSNPEKFHSYDVIEIMACPFGCIGGAGQPSPSAEKLQARRKALFEIDAKSKERSAMQNPAVQKVYKNYLLKPGSEVSYSILHLKRICLKCD